MTKPDRVVPLGSVFITPNAQRKLSDEDAQQALARHARGDWGEVDEHDQQENELSLEQGFRLLSAYIGQDSTRFWIITEADRPATTVLLPEDY